ncbi:hypothetical protein ACFWF7_31440 [Nocardia sp. NPDC060256]|uniref:hypothetical protein n=1 Tax=unclassified Nocardia TaxID=2637762 RepID=UPI00365E2EBF
MKRVLTVLVGVVVIWGAAACSDDSTPAPGTSTPKVTTTSAAATTTIPITTTVAPPPTSPQQRGADGSTNNNLSPEYCAKNQDPGCPLGSYIGPNAIQNPNGDGTWVPCEGTICTNPNYGAGPETTPQVAPSTTPQDTARVEGAPCEGDGRWVHLTGDNAAHYGTEWLCQH